MQRHGVLASERAVATEIDDGRGGGKRMDIYAKTREICRFLVGEGRLRPEGFGGSGRAMLCDLEGAADVGGGGVKPTNIYGRNPRKLPVSRCLDLLLFRG